MKSAASAVFATSLVFVTAHAQQAQSDRPATASAATPAPGMDSSALAGSARASKIIGSNVYHGDTSIGQIEDVLVNLDSATSTAMILSVGRLSRHRR